MALNECPMPDSLGLHVVLAWSNALPSVDTWMGHLNMKICTGTGGLRVGPVFRSHHARANQLVHTPLFDLAQN